MDKSYIEKFEKVLIEEDSVLDTILIKQKELHDSISNKNWTDLMSLISAPWQSRCSACGPATLRQRRWAGSSR